MWTFQPNDRATPNRFDDHSLAFASRSLARPAKNHRPLASKPRRRGLAELLVFGDEAADDRQQLGNGRSPGVEWAGAGGFFMIT